MSLSKTFWGLQLKWFQISFRLLTFLGPPPNFFVPASKSFCDIFMQGPNFLRTKLFGDQISWKQTFWGWNFSGTKYLGDQTFWGPNLSGTKSIRNQIYQEPNLSGTKFIGNPNLSGNQIYQESNLLGTKKVRGQKRSGTILRKFWLMISAFIWKYQKACIV